MRVIFTFCNVHLHRSTMWYATKTHRDKRMCIREEENTRKKTHFRYMLEKWKIVQLFVLAWEAQCVAIKSIKDEKLWHMRRLTTKQSFPNQMNILWKRHTNSQSTAYAKWNRRTPTHQSMVIKYQKEKTLSVRGHKKQTEKRRRKKKRVVYGVYIT